MSPEEIEALKYALDVIPWSIIIIFIIVLNIIFIISKDNNIPRL